LKNIDKNSTKEKTNQKEIHLINMTENQRHWKQTTTGRKNIPIEEFGKQSKKTKKSKEPESLEEALTGE